MDRVAGVSSARPGWLESKTGVSRTRPQPPGRAHLAGSWALPSRPEGGPTAQYALASITSPLPVVPRAHQVTTPMLLLMKRELPSAMPTFTPPEW